MKLKIVIDCEFVKAGKTLEYIIDWELPIIPQKGDCIFIDYIVDLPDEVDPNTMWRVWSVDWRPMGDIPICPTLWLQHADADY